MVRDGVAEIIQHAEDLSVCGTASTANEGLGLLTKLKPDLVLLDITLPGENGVEFIKDARAMQPDLRVLAMSMHDESLYADRVLRAGGRSDCGEREDDRTFAGEVFRQSNNGFATGRTERP